MPATVVVVGCSGGVGACAARSALASGATVRALARTRSKAEKAIGADAFGQLDAFVEGSVSDASALGALLNAASAGADPATVTVLSCLGTPRGSDPCVESGTRYVMEAMARAGLSRLVMISSIGVGDSLAQGQAMAPIFIRCIVPLFLRKVFADLERAEELCWSGAGGVRCVSVRPPALTDKPGRGDYKLEGASNLRASKTTKIAREDVAAAMVALAGPAFDEWAGKGATVVVP